MANLAGVFLFYCCAMLLAPLALFADPLAWPVTMYHNLQDFFGPNATSTLLVVAGQHSEWTTPQVIKPMDDPDPAGAEGDMDEPDNHPPTPADMTALFDAATRAVQMAHTAVAQAQAGLG